MERVEKIAAVCHQANKAWCEANGDESQVDWADTPQEIRDSAIDGVRNALHGATPEQSHENWCRFKREHGWVWGETKDLDAKTHPCLVAYHELPDEQQVKDVLFTMIVTALR